MADLFDSPGKQSSDSGIGSGMNPRNIMFAVAFLLGGGVTGGGVSVFAQPGVEIKALNRTVAELKTEIVAVGVKIDTYQRRLTSLQGDVDQAERERKTMNDAIHGIQLTLARSHPQ